jgi:hypothetical protein
MLIGCLPVCICFRSGPENTLYIEVPTGAYWPAHAWRFIDVVDVKVLNWQVATASHIVGSSEQQERCSKERESMLLCAD